MISKVARSLPDSVTRVGKLFYVNIHRFLGRNYCTYSYNDRDFTIYYNESTISIVRHLVEGDKITKEEISLDYLKASQPVDAVIDIGAFHGTYSVLLQALNPSAALYAFEPDDANRAVVQSLLKENQSNGTVSDEVITNQTGEVTFYVDPLPESERHSTTPKQGFEPIERPCLALSTLTDREGLNSVFVKIDAEGEEFQIIQDLFSTNIPYIEGIVELHPDKLDVPMSKIVGLLTNNADEYEFITETAPDYEYDRPMYYFLRKN
jgi:FkbM family methyltransferase